MDAISVDLRQATDDLLDLNLNLNLNLQTRPATPQLHALSPRPVAASPSPSPLRLTIESPARAYSPSAKLTKLDSPTDIKPPSLLSPPLHSAAGQSSGTSSSPAPRGGSTGRTRHATQQNDSLPSTGLSSIVESVKPAASGSGALHGSLRLEGSASRSTLSHSISDIWLNEYGERVVDGKVVSKMRGGRKRGESEGGAPLSDEFGLPAPVQPAEGSTGGWIETSQTAESTRGQLPPAFFLQSFPDAVQPGRRTASPLLQVPGATGSLTPSISAPALLSRQREPSEPESYYANGRTQEDGPTSRAASPASDATQLNAPRSPASSAATLPDRVPSPLPSGLFSPIRAEPVSSVVPAQTAPLMLPAKRPKARRATDTPLPREWPDQDATLEYDGPSTSAQGASRETLRSPHSFAVSPTRAAEDTPLPTPLTARAASLFYTPLVPTAPQGSSGTDWSVEGSSHHTSSVSAPSSPTIPSEWNPDGSSAAPSGDADDSDRGSVCSDPSSLLSLPVSTLTASSLAPSALSAGSGEGQGPGQGRPGHARRRSGGRSRRYDGDECFAREVRVRGWSEVGEKARGWVVYDVRIVTRQVSHHYCMRSWCAEVQR